MYGGGGVLYSEITEQVEIKEREVQSCGKWKKYNYISQKNQD